MGMRVATFASSDRLLQAALKVQAKQAEATLQQASGQISEDYGGLGSKAGSVVSLQSSISMSKSYAEAASTAGDRVEAMYDAVDSIIEQITSMKATLSSFASTTSGTDELKVTAEEMLESLASLMNTQLGGRYLFSGSAVDTAPVDLDSLATATSPSSSDTSYYRGDDAITSVKVSSEQTVSYGVTADDENFEKALRALSLVASGATDEDTLSEASDLLDEAISGLATVQTRLSLNASALETAISDQENYQEFAGNLATSLSGVDVAVVAAEMSAYETQLQAAYAAIGNIASLSLSSYLS
ncbi:flagellar biosynthesis protein FlgL [Pleomorphomonas diazotrophica]|uniref:Flagellar biosynthesis protein FlgL n=1 Tax=Pleomorphomonas diazotrophica TaxID=1166257 RepID=A0A1I4QPJ4_9HYPH|nr:flagellin [Pleomorphomonas diazotrophica]PKR90533.1 flagellar biosynthesis protein FlgL [Pleomorphomonas diazotrophica]SFM41636.1 flagellar hook-associated protein 3 FlgL [Pleomorphomonas diazotrophica]